MPSEWLVVAAPVLGLAANAAVQVGCCRALPAWGRLRSVYAGFGAGLAAAMALSSFELRVASCEPARSFFDLLANLVAYGALGYGYFHFVNLGETARRIRILRELAESEGGLTLGELLARYNAREIVQRRLKRLLDTRQVVLRDGRYRIGRTAVLRMAEAMALMKRLLLGGSRERGL